MKLPMWLLAQSGHRCSSSSNSRCISDIRATSLFGPTAREGNNSIRPPALGSGCGGYTLLVEPHCTCRFSSHTSSLVRYSCIKTHSRASPPLPERKLREAHTHNMLILL